MQDAVDARPSVFLSHASEDKPFVRRLARELRKAEVKVWIDEADLKPGDSLIDRIDHAIGRLDFLVVVISPDSVASTIGLRANSAWRCSASPSRV